MIGYITIGSNDLQQAREFYSDLFAEMGVKVLMDMGRLVLFGTKMGQPMFGVCKPFDKQPATPGNGNMVSLPAGSRENVDKLHAKALALGATDEGAPGARMPTFYAAYFRDIDGNKIAFFHMG